MRMYDIIAKKKYGGELTKEEIDTFITGYTKGEIPDYQASALCMAICLKGMTDRETWLLTDAMMHSGDTVDLSAFGNLSVDKHSTGGVGDKVSPVVGPVVASLGCKMAKMSGRGLGHTGGTVDKLESIPGYRTEMNREEFFRCVDRNGMAILGQSGDLAPADKKLYALRDVTATVDCISLIASSIMSKKLAAGAHNLVLDVKTGSGAFMKTVEDSIALAHAMVRIGRSAGRNVQALVTNMDVPLGTNVGNALEIEEAVRVVRGERKGDLYEVCMAICERLVSMSLEIPVEKARRMSEESIASGQAFESMKKWVAGQGGDVSVLEHPEKLRPQKEGRAVRATGDGYVCAMDTEAIGRAVCVLGAGRMKKEDRIDLSAGLEVLKKTGDTVRTGDCLTVLYGSSERALDEAERIYRSALRIGPEAVDRPTLIYASVSD